MGTLKTSLSVRAVTGLVGVLGAVTLLGSTRWWNATFPVFFVMPNRVVASAGLPGWAGGDEGRPVYQKVLLSIDGRDVSVGSRGQERPGTHAAGRHVTYAFATDGAPDQRTISIRHLAPLEYLGIFGVYFLTGLAYLALSAVAGERTRRQAAARALAPMGWIGAIFVFTAMDLYGPGRFFRLHAAAEVLLLATCVHLVLVWPRPLAGTRGSLVQLVYGLGGMLALIEQLFLYEPRAYSVLHNLVQGLTLVPTILLAVRLGLIEAADAAAATWGRLQVGVVIGFVGPALVFGASSLAGGNLPVSVAGWLNVVFPLVCVRALRELDGAAGGGVDIVIEPDASAELTPTAAAQAAS
jgi:hypothetical protein